MKKQLIFILLSSICLTAGCARETETISTTDIIAKEARQDQSADLIRVQDRVYKRSGKDMTIAKKDLVAITTVQKQLSGKEALADRTATDVFLALAWMEHWYVAITPLLFFTLINWITLKRGTGRMNQVERVSYGTVYYPMALALLVLFFFEQEPMALVAGSMVLAWGDGLAALVGKRFGKTFYTRGKIRRSFEGSIAMFLASFLVLTVTFLLYEEPAWLAVSYGFLLANIAALIEAVSYRDTDNLLIPLTIGALVAFAL